MQVGDYARYKNTGTVGKVVDISTEAGVTWVCLDTTDLCYDASTLEPAREEEYREVAQREKDLKAKLSDVEELTSALEKIDISRITPSGT